MIVKPQAMRTSYHNHTTWSDGKATLEEMIKSARKAGLEEFGVSDHYVLSPGNSRFDWALAPESLDDYVEQVQKAIASNKDITIRMGLEVDYFPETMEQIKKQLAPYPFDYLITSVHFINDFPIDLELKSWEELSQDARNGIWRAYWQRLRAAAASGYFDIIGHFDLPKKYAYYPSVDLTEAALSVLDAMAAAGMAIEINCSGWDKPVQEAYPSFFYLQEAKRRNIPLVINSDAHSADDIARNFDRGLQMAAAAGYTELVRFESRKRFSYPL
jgi:histidinol-phosphatase (PHP family)